MRHYIIAKFKKAYNYRAELDNIKALFDKLRPIPGMADIIIHPSNSTRENRHDLMIEMILTKEALDIYDRSDIHRQWKELYGPYIESKTIFDCEG